MPAFRAGLAAAWLVKVPPFRIVWRAQVRRKGEIMDPKQTIKSQYYAALEMLKQAIEA